VLLLFVNVPVLAQVEKYSSKGKLVRIDWFRPPDDKGKPIVLLLYGSSGGGDSDYFAAARSSLPMLDLWRVWFIILIALTSSGRVLLR